MDNLELKKVTQGEGRQASLVLHIFDIKNERNYEMVINHVCHDTLTLRYD